MTGVVGARAHNRGGGAAGSRGGKRVAVGSDMVAARPLSRPELAATTLVLGIEAKAVLLVERGGAPVSSIAPALRVGYLATAMTVDERGLIVDLVTAPFTVDPGQASQHLANLGATYGSLRGTVAVVGLIGDAATTEIVRASMDQLRTAGVIDRWIEALDPMLLRLRLERLLGVIEPSPRVRDEIYGGWELALTFQLDGLADVIADLERRRPRLRGATLAAVDAVLDFVGRHRARANYGALRRRGIELPVSTRRRDEHLPVRMARSRCRPVTVEV